ncbi:NAD(P)-binding protein [Lophiostoma macrostomum CBS 122681]|uniref:NAD(P)-binding protein n=1 Tax=Lophiostoma macrostomum CBS 122681 TaxID=1314788 RepID=A0A6A6T862_9PLEO|nr:NAD(P)-binding protein [Lophiostoma macrostomum CBS 122681]
MSSSTRTIVIFGAGPGIGNHVASEFASNSFNHVILLARNESRLREDKAAIANASSNVKVDALRLDLSDIASIPAVLKKIDELAPELDVVFFNAARIKASGVLEVSVEEIDEDFKTTNLALYVISQWAIPRLQARAKSSSSPKSAKPALLVTNSHLPWDPVPQLLSLSLVKASQANMVQSFSRAFSDSGIHIGLIHVEGVVAPENKNRNPKNIARKIREFYESGEGLTVHIKE